MSKMFYFVLGGIILVVIFIVVWYTILGGLKNIGNPTGGRGPERPYFITTEPVIVKKVSVPIGTKLTYEEQFFKEGKQDKIMDEVKLTTIELQGGQTIDWGGVPVVMINKFFNSEMLGYSVYADFEKLDKDK